MSLEKDALLCRAAWQASCDLCLVRGVGRAWPLIWELKRGAGRLLKILRISKDEPRNGGDNVVNEPKANSPMSDGDPGTVRRTAPKGQSNDYYVAPLGSLSSGHLLFVSGTSNVTIHADPSMEYLYRARFEDQVPTVRVQGGTVTIEYSPFPSLDQGYYWLERPAEVALNASVTWHIEVRGSTSRLTADLHELRLGSIKLAGGASRIEVRLPRPSGTVSVRISGGASNVIIHRPEGVAARVHAGGGATHLTFDEKHFGVIGGDVNLRGPDYDDAANRYYFEVMGGANNLTIDAR